MKTNEIEIDKATLELNKAIKNTQLAEKMIFDAQIYYDKTRKELQLAHQQIKELLDQIHNNYDKYKNQDNTAQKTEI